MRRQTEVLVGELAVSGLSLIIHVIQEEILVIIGTGAERAQRCHDLRLHLGVELIALALEHGRSGVLRTHVAAGFRHAKGLAGQGVGMMHQVAEVSEIQEVMGKLHCRHAVREEILEAARLHRIHIVVEVEETLREPGNPVKEHLYHGTVERGQMPLGHNVLVKHHVHRFPVHPLGHLAFPCYHQMDAVDVGHELVQPAEMVLQRAPVPEALVQDLLPDRALVVLLPKRVQPVDICNDCVHIILSLNSLSKTPDCRSGIHRRRHSLSASRSRHRD